MSDTTAPDLRAAATELAAAGLCVLPIKADGTKAPAVRTWTPYKTRTSTPDEHDAWFTGHTDRGIAVIYGHVSGDVELLEFEGRAITEGIHDQVADIMQASGLGDIWQAITTGWATRSPSGGIHYRIRITGWPVPPNTKLASRPACEDEYTLEEKQRLAEKPGARIIRVLIETRGEGGYAVTEPSGGTVHNTGLPWERIAGGPATIPAVDADILAAVHEICRMVDALPKQDTPRTAPRQTTPLPSGGLRPGEDYEAKTDWADILQPAGWTYITQHGRTRYWRRPGKSIGVSATTGHAEDRDRLYVFTTSTEFLAETPYTKFGAYALLHHGGDHRAAAAELRRRGYGSEPPHRPLAIVPPAQTASTSPTTDGNTALAPAEQPATPEPQPGLRLVPAELPRIDITNEADAIDAILAAMSASHLPDLYKRSGGPCWVYQDDQGNPLVKQLATDNLRAYLAEHLITYQVVNDPDTKGTKEVRELVMPKTCATILGRRDWPLSPLRGIVTSPVVRPDGTLLTAPGYDQATGLYLFPRVPVRRLADTVISESVQRALNIILRQMLADFPFVDASDRAHYLGALLAPIIRPYVPGPTPMLLITSTSQGSGKTLLKDILGKLFGLSETPWPENDAELRKAVTAKLWDSGDPIISLDNLPNGHIVKSPILSSLLTSSVWSDRILGQSSSVVIPNDRLWVLNGNNLRTGGDNQRRALWCRLDPDCPNPDQRDNFTIGDLRAWLDEHASTVVAALVTLVRSWLAAGAPRINTRMGDYSRWASAVAGILNHLDVPGWLTNRGQSDGLDDEVQEWAAFLTAWHQAFGERAVPGKELLALDEVPQPLTGDKPSVKQLGQWLKAREGRYFDDLKIVRIYDSHRKVNFWRVARHGAES